MLEIVVPEGTHILLSHLLQDPVVYDEDHGVLHSFGERNSYLQYAATKLWRVLSMTADIELLYDVYKDAVEISDPQPYVDVSGDAYKKGVEDHSLANWRVLSIRTSDGAEVQKTSFLDRNIYSTQFSNQDYWYPMQDKIIVSPKLRIAGVKMIMVLIKRIHLYPCSEYADFIITLAAERGWLNVGNSNKSVAFAQSFASEIQLIGQKRQMDKAAQ